MATTRKTAKKTGTRRSSAKPDVNEQAERLSRTLSESAQQVWLAGVGAFARAQAEGSKLFDALAKEGATLEKDARKYADDRAEEVRDAVESRVEKARGRASDTWDKLERVFEDRVQRALLKLGVPNRDDVTELNRRVEGLTAELRRQGRAAPPRKTAKKGAARKSAAKKSAAGTATGKPAAARKAPAKAAKRAGPQAG